MARMIKKTFLCIQLYSYYLDRDNYWPTALPLGAYSINLSIKDCAESMFPPSNRHKETATATIQWRTIRQWNVAPSCPLTRTTITNGLVKTAIVCPLVRSTVGTTHLWWKRTIRTHTRILTILTVTVDPQEATARSPGTGFELKPAGAATRRSYDHLDSNNLLSMCSNSVSPFSCGSSQTSFSN